MLKPTIKQNFIFQRTSKNYDQCCSFWLWEITLKDFESFMNGCILAKPSLNHMNTWPEFYMKIKHIFHFLGFIRYYRKNRDDKKQLYQIYGYRF